jgi:hypothetical protein
MFAIPTGNARLQSYCHIHNEVVAIAFPQVHKLPSTFWDVRGTGRVQIGFIRRRQAKRIGIRLR